VKRDSKPWVMSHDQKESKPIKGQGSLQKKKIEKTRKRRKCLRKEQNREISRQKYVRKNQVPERKKRECMKKGREKSCSVANRR